MSGNNNGGSSSSSSVSSIPSAAVAVSAAAAVASAAAAAANAIRNSGGGGGDGGGSNNCCSSSGDSNTMLLQQTITTPEGGENNKVASATTATPAVVITTSQQQHHQQQQHHHHHHRHQLSPLSSSSSPAAATTTTTTTIPPSAIVLPTQPAVASSSSAGGSPPAPTARQVQHDCIIACNLCPKTFASQKLLQQHQHMFHTDKAFICEICGKAFRFRSNLAEHRSVHTALKPYVCKFCGKSSRLKGNLTKHILKHHKQEQNAYIGKDDIIIKKGKKSVKDPAAVDFLEKSMIVLTSGASENPLTLLPQKDEPMEDENDKSRSIFMSLGLDTGSMDLRSNSPEEESIFAVHGEKSAESLMDGQMGMTGGAELVECEEGPSTSPLNNISTNEHLTSLIAHVANNVRTQCPECGKHFRKGSSLQVHMTLNHGFPPPGSSISSDDQAEKSSDCGTSTEPPNCPNEDPSTAPVHQEIKEIKSMIGELRSAQSTARVEQLLTGLDTRVGRLEKQLEMALNSIYTLVQLQTGINSSVTRFREEACEQLKTVKAMLSESSV